MILGADSTEVPEGSVLVPFSWQGVSLHAAGASAVRVVPYTLATVVGLLPGTAAVVILGGLQLIALSVIGEYIGRIPLRRIGRPPDQAAAVLFLASDEASFITGQTLVVDGGSSARPSTKSSPFASKWPMSQLDM